MCHLSLGAVTHIRRTGYRQNENDMLAVRRRNKFFINDDRLGIFIRLVFCPSYVILDGDKLQFRRVKYDVEKTIKKIYEIPELDNFLGDRLRDGR